MALAKRWDRIQAGLLDDWGEAALLLAVSDAREADRAARILGPLNAVRRGNRLRFHAARRGAGQPPALVRRLLARVDAEGIEGRLELVSTTRAEAERQVERPALAAQWDAAVNALPSDWSDAWAEIELRSTDDLDRAALLSAPVNPARERDRPAFRFRVARRFGYGASSAMARRCLARLDEQGIRATVRVLRVLSDSRPVATQGPVWYVGGKVV